MMIDYGYGQEMGAVLTFTCRLVELDLVHVICVLFVMSVN